jgi:subtilase family serine protease
MRRSRSALLVALGVTIALVVSGVPGAEAATGDSNRHPLVGSRPLWLAEARPAATAPGPADVVQFGLVLTMRDRAGAEETLAKVTDPAGASYAKWLTPTEFDARYAPSAAEVAAVKSWLGRSGFTVRSTASRMYIGASGTVSHVDKTFGTTVKSYVYKARTVRANSTELSLPPDAPSGVIAGVVGLDQQASFKAAARSAKDGAAPEPTAGFRDATPCSPSLGATGASDLPAVDGTYPPYVVCSYEPRQFQEAYGVGKQLTKGVNGNGVTVAVTGVYASPTMAQDLATLSRRHGLPAIKAGQYRQIVPTPDKFQDVDECGGNVWYSEETVAVEAVHMMAPGANIVYVGGTDCNSGLDEAFGSAIDQHVGDIVTNNWGSSTDKPEDLGAALIAYYEQYSMKAAMTGITVTFSSGDQGDQTSGGTDPAAKSVGFPRDLPFVTAVGGTSVGLDKQGTRVWEHGWSTAYQSISGTTWTAPAFFEGSGGGASIIYPQPAYQKGRVPAAIATVGGKAMRTIPDIAMPADPNTATVIGQTQTFPDGVRYDENRYGGTSLSAPLFSGLIAVANQKAGHSLGFVNPLLYKMLGTAALNDIKPPVKPLRQVRSDFVNAVDASDGRVFHLQTVDVQSQLIHTRPRYDDETGTGTPGAQFFDAVH